MGTVVSGRPIKPYSQAARSTWEQECPHKDSHERSGVTIVDEHIAACSSRFAPGSASLGRYLFRLLAWSAAWSVACRSSCHGFCKPYSIQTPNLASHTSFNPSRPRCNSCPAPRCAPPPAPHVPAETSSLSWIREKAGGDGLVRKEEGGSFPQGPGPLSVALPWCCS